MTDHIGYVYSVTHIRFVSIHSDICIMKSLSSRGFSLNVPLLRRDSCLVFGEREGEYSGTAFHLQGTPGYLLCSLNLFNLF